jgi:hypothetical protein
VDFIVVDHRHDPARRVDFGTCSKVATHQDFREAVLDEIADYIQFNKALIIEAKKLSDLLSQ